MGTMSQATERIRMPDTVTLSCPKCAASMRSYERNGVTIEQCVECRGVFLDRGELDHLIDAETSHYRSRSASSRPDYDKAAHDGSRG